ncbi:MAG: type II CRISPR-associated endonuclease Cas1 [Rikenellaceae bacterium]
MIKKTLYFGNPAYLSVRQLQLVLRLPKDEVNEIRSENFNQNDEHTIPIEDIGVLVLDNGRITITHGLIEALLENNVAIITCDKHRMPVGLMLPLCGNTTQSERFREQINASLPLKKQLWQQTIQSKITNQARILNECRGVEIRNMLKWVNDVRSGDADNLEGRAAVYYWANLFDNFLRNREGDSPNNLLNYGYAILRAVIARALVSSGLLPTIGIFHHNRYNAYCLADDIMEPYRPYVDKLVFEMYKSGVIELDKDAKSKLLSIPVLGVKIGGKCSPLMVAAGLTTSSLYKCFKGESRRILYPEV